MGRLEVVAAAMLNGERARRIEECEERGISLCGPFSGLEYLPRWVNADRGIREPWLQRARDAVAALDMGEAHHD